ncbi:MAG: hypothetical protein KA586_04975 [Candidatus Promineofilum sp.]|nr:hypothetical protein [Promineifilum sp.]
MTDDSTELYPRPAGPNPDLRELDRLVGTWRISGEAQGQVSYEWMEGGYFLMQRVELLSEDGSWNRGIEIIGHEQRLMEAPSDAIKSRFYGNDGATFDYVHEMDGDTLTIWAVEKGSPAYYKGTFSADGNTLTGSWVYPNGGGYTTTATRIS